MFFSELPGQLIGVITLENLNVFLLAPTDVYSYGQELWSVSCMGGQRLLLRVLMLGQRLLGITALRGEKHICYNSFITVNIYTWVIKEQSLQLCLLLGIIFILINVMLNGRVISL